MATATGVTKDMKGTVVDERKCIITIMEVEVMEEGKITSTDLVGTKSLVSIIEVHLEVTQMGSSCWLGLLSSLVPSPLPSACIRMPSARNESLKTLKRLRYCQ